MCLLFCFYVYSRWAFLPTLNVKADTLPLSQRLETRILNGAEMNKYICAVVAGDESKTFFLVKPLYGTFWHC